MKLSILGLSSIMMMSCMLLMTKGFLGTGSIMFRNRIHSSLYAGSLFEHATVGLRDSFFDLGQSGLNPDNNHQYDTKLIAIVEKWPGGEIWPRPGQNVVINLTAVLGTCGADKALDPCLELLTSENPITSEGGASRHLLPAETQNFESKEGKRDTDPPAVPQLFHSFWQGTPSEKVVLMALSFLYTQRLDQSALIIWTLLREGQSLESALSDSPIAKSLLDYAPHIQIREWKESEEMMGTPFEELITSHEHDTVGYSDMVRFFVCWKHGGLYVDADVLFLRDFGPLLSAPVDFAYQWSFHEWFNTAIMRLTKGSPLAVKVAEYAIKQHGASPAGFHPHVVANVSLASGLPLILPPQPFQDPEWTATFDSLTTAAGSPQTTAFLFGDPRIPQLISEEPRQGQDRAFVMLPVDVFDPLWLHNEYDSRGRTDGDVGFAGPHEEPYSFDRFVTGQPSEMTSTCTGFFDGAYAYHWHNRWTVPCAVESVCGHYWHCYTNFVQGLQPNIYGEFYIQAIR